MPSASRTGGAEEAFWQLIISNAGKRIEWQTIFLEAGALVEEVKPFVCESFVVQAGRTRNLLRWYKASRAIAQAASRFESQCILGWMTKGQVYGGLAAWQSKIPATWFQMGYPERGWLDQVARRLPTHTVFACSEFVATLQRTVQPKSRIVSIPLGADLARFDLNTLPTVESAREKLGLPTSRPIVGIVGRLQKWKGFHIYLESIPKVLKKHPDAYFVVVGGPYPAEPEYEPQLKRMAEELGIMDRVRFAGAQKDVPLWMQSFDIFVHASEREPFGIVVVEALALGKKVIATIPGGPAEVIKHNVDGWLVNYGDANELAACICDAINSPPIASARAIGESFSNEAYAAKLVSAVVEISDSVRK